jgi:D-aminoacyl-tRNA deacylase
MILIAYSVKDVAGTNIAKKVLEDFSFRKTDASFQDNPVYLAQLGSKQVSLVTLKNETVYAQDLPEHFADLELVVFLSRHSSQSGKPTLSVHTPGNFGDAELGGLPRTLSVSPAKTMQDTLKALMHFKNEMNLDYEVSYECTHHGPSLNVPTMFVELGSSLQQWNDSNGAEVVAKAAIQAVANFKVSQQTAVIGIGGPHYNPKFTRMALNNEALFGHMIPKYALSNVDVATLQQCVDRTLEKVTCVVLDWKGIPSQDKPKLLETLTELKISYRKT